MIAETDDTDSVTASYTYGDDLLSMMKSGEIWNYQYDGLGSTRSLTDSSGSESDTYTYDAFGNLLSEMGETDNSYLYTGEQFDSSLGQYYLRARYFDQSNGRFTQMDTWMGREALPLTLNKYVYGLGDPVSFVDPSGNIPILAMSVNSAIAGIVRGDKGVKTGLAGRRLIFKAGCFALEKAAGDVIHGIYLFEDVRTPNKGHYGGKSIDVQRRLKEHARKKIHNVKALIMSFAVTGDAKVAAKDALKVAEQYVIDTIDKMVDDPDNKHVNKKSNQRNAFNKKKHKNLRNLLKKVDWCK